MNRPGGPPRATYAGLFFTALATLMFEILLTRIFSATTWYHFAFMAVSVAMFGMTAGAIAVYLLPKLFTQERVHRHLALSTTAFAVSLPLAFLTQLSIPFVETTSAVGIFTYALTYAVVSIPFFFSGIAICLALSRFPGRVGALYGADLAGAALGCILLIQALRVTDGPTAVLITGTLAALGALFFALGSGERGALRWSTGALLLLGGSAAAHAGLATDGRPWIHPIWIKGQYAGRPLYEQWNSFSRISIRPYRGGVPVAPFGWGLSEKCTHTDLLTQYSLFIDGMAGTVITEFDGTDVEPLGFLECDVTNVAHELRSDADVLVVGVGGGRDLLAALVYDQKSVTGIEMNGDILETVNGIFGDFSGHLDRHPDVELVNEEARSWIARSERSFDIIQISLIDTWAATSAGAFVLAENALYTREAWDIFLEHLEDDGLLTVSRWYVGTIPAEMYRTVSLAADALKARGVADPGRHLALVRSGAPDAVGVGTLLVGRDPLSDADLAALRARCDELGFSVEIGAGEPRDPVLAALARGDEVEALPTGLRLDLSPPTDDSPFFFNMLRLADLFDADVRHHAALEANTKAVLILGILLIVVTVLTSGCILLPLLGTTRKGDLTGTLPLFLFFASIGFGFLLVELSQMHRLILFLGHPTYGLSVVLFSLLISSGIGSLWSGRIQDVRRDGPRVLGVLLGLLVVFGLVTPSVVHAFESLGTPARVGIAVASLFPMGLLMGTAFPMGMRLASRDRANLTPWLWGINGATSVCASVLATAIALSFSISTAFWCGFACYVSALLTFVWASRRSAAEA